MTRNFVDAWRALRTTSAFAVREVACVGAPRTLLVADRVPQPHASWVMIGVVGDDESSGAWAVLSIARDGLLPNDLAYRLWPALACRGETPRRGGPEARAVATANRDRRFGLALEIGEADVAEFTCLGDVDALGSVVALTLRDAGFSFAGGPMAAFVLPKGHSARFVKLIAPAAAAWDERIAMQRLAVVGALQAAHDRRCVESNTP